MDSEKKETFEQDSNIVLRGDPQKFFEMKLTTIFIRIVYPGVLSTLLVEHGLETAKNYVRDLGYRVSKYVFNYFRTKSNEFEKIIDELGQKLWGTKFKIQFDKKREIYKISPKSCPLCEDLPPLEIEGLHYCVPLEGFLIGYFELLKKHNLFYFEEIIAKVIHSKGSGADNCLYEVKLVK